MNSGRGRSIFELFSDRMKKQGWYDTAAYWDMKAEKYTGLARSAWPSNTYNELIHASQMATIDKLLGDVAGQRVADVGCGTGRTARHLAGRGAIVHAWDFSPKAVEAAKQETAEAGLSATFDVGNVLEPAPVELQGTFDAVISLGCLTMACPDLESLDGALGNLTALLRPGGRLLFIEPIHKSTLLRRILQASIEEWLGVAAKHPLELLDRGGLQFVPARYLLAFRDMPKPFVSAVYGAGEAVLGLSPQLERLSDYKTLLFRKTVR